MPPRSKSPQKKRGPKKKSQGSTESPYTVFNNWLFDQPIENALPSDVVKKISVPAVLAMFSNHDEFTIFLNNHFNNYNLMKMTPYTFFKFIREIVRKRRISKWDVMFFKRAEKDELNNIIRRKYPYLKPYEIPILLKSIENTDTYDQLMDVLGLTKFKKEKMGTKAKAPSKRGRKPKADLL